VEVRHGNALGDTAHGTVVQSNATLLFNGTFTSAEPLTLNGSGVTSTAGALHVTGGSNVTLTGGIKVANGQITVTPESNSRLNLTGSFATSGVSALAYFRQYGVVEVSGQVSDDPDNAANVLRIRTYQSGTLILSNPNTSFTGDLEICGGTLAFTNAGALGHATGKVKLGFGSGSIGTLAYTGTSEATVQRSLILGFDTTSPGGGGTILANGTGRLIVSSDIDVLPGVTVSSLNLTLGGNSASTVLNTFNGNITSGPSTVVNLYKEGTSTWILAGTNAYGNTTVSGGTLLVNGSHTGTGNVTVSSAATLGGTGSLAGNVSIAAGATLTGNVTFGGPVSVAGNHTPGNSAAQATFAGGLSYASTSILEWELFANSVDSPGTNYDQLLVTGGSLTIADDATLSLVFDGAGSSVDFTDAFWATAHNWTLIDYSGTGTSTGLFTNLTSNTIYAAYGNFSVANVEGDVQLSWTPVPEPSTIVLLIGGGVCGAGLLWRRRRRAARGPAASAEDGSVDL